MKKIILILLVIGTFYSCDNGSEISVNEIVAASIVGHWTLVDWYDDTPRDINEDGNASTDLFSQWNGCKKQSTLILENDNTGRIVYNGENGNPKCPPGFETNDFFTIEPWEINSTFNEFTLVGDDYLDVYEIVELTAETLILKGAGFYTCCDFEISYYTGGYLRFERE